MAVTIVEFLGQRCITLDNGFLKVLVTQSVGPRVLALIVRGDANLFAELPSLAIERPGQPPFRFYGGHRLWHAPEDPVRTYLPDDRKVDVEILPDGVKVSQVEPLTGLSKTMEVHLAAERPWVIVTHTLTNVGLWPISCAPWAITQLKVGGVAILPQSRIQTDVLPNRSLAIWPYTDLKSPFVKWGNSYILVEACMNSPFKIGFPNPRGWLAYWWNQMLFVKRAPFDAEARYCDFGSSSECYCNEHFLELETLGPMRFLERGAATSHVEIWEVYPDVPRPGDEAAAETLVRRLNLEE
ncbi:MAG: hypothetical protein J7460_08125 [Chloroflexus sp.]|jgi:hypothetical protein|nr:hypothetical protein [Chloroflexus sp.]